MDIANLIISGGSLLTAAFAVYKWMDEKRIRKKNESKLDLEIIKDYQEVAERVSNQFNEASKELAILRDEVSTLKIEKNSCIHEIDALKKENAELKIILRERGLI